MSPTARSKTLARVALAAALLAAFVAGFALRGPGQREARRLPAAADGPEGRQDAEQIWTCSMHPQIRLPGPGDCPICGMDLIPARAGGVADAGAERTMVLSEAARRLAEVRTVPVERRMATVQVRMVGKVDYDETRTSTITAYVPGRLERLFVDYTGLRVERGDHMVTIYSPELIAAQEELLQAIRASHTLERSELEVMRRTARDTVDAARERLRLWGLLPEQIAAVEQRGEPREVVTLYSPMSGVVIEKNALQGQYVQTGSRIYTIADLAHLWVRLEAYESDIEWVHLGQEVEFTTEAYPGTTFSGRISFVDSVVDSRTRTVNLRVNVPNRDGRLKPGMLVRALVQAQIAGEGRVFDPYLAGKWISPMHPEIVKDGPGTCDVCGMDLVPAEKLGFVRRAEAVAVPLVVPASAPLITGRRAVVYVEQVDAERPTYVGREVVLGPRAGDFYIVRSGLDEGERVVVEGNFKIDSALQIEARPSMMSPAGDAPPAAHDHAGGAHGDGARPAAAPAAQGGSGAAEVFEAYLAIQGALAHDDIDGARAGLDRLEGALAAVDAGGLDAAAAAGWRRAEAALHAATVAGRNAVDLAAARQTFHALSGAAIAWARELGHALPRPLNVAHCPMAFESGAEWLQGGDAIENPYFGSMMFRCGSIRARLPEGAAAGR